MNVRKPKTKITYTCNPKLKPQYYKSLFPDFNYTPEQMIHIVNTVAKNDKTNGGNNKWTNIF